MPDDPKHLLLVEDQDALRQLLADQLALRGYQVQQVATGEAAVARLNEFAFDLIVTDLRLPGIDGSAVADAAVALYPEIIAVVVTGYGTVKDAVAAIKRGAWDFVLKPIQIDELVRVLAAALEHRRLRAENAYLRAELHERDRYDALVGKSPSMRRVFQMIETVAAANSTILISGETGTGKEVVARAIHQTGPRREHRFVVLNCGAIQEALQEAELFGHVRGAFTGAVGSRIGRLELAHNGTLFLDEVGAMSATLQMKLLRVLQEREFERLGDSHTVRVDVRVIAATNSDLMRMVAEGQFRDDLYYRLNVIPIELSPLRQRKEDIPLLVQHFLTKASQPSKTLGDPGPAVRRLEAPRSVTQDAMRCLMAYHWPGNVRELENALARAAAFSAGKSHIEAGDLASELVHPDRPALSAAISLPDNGIDLAMLVAEVERELIHRSLERTGGNKRQAAQLLNLKRTTLVEKLKRLDRV